jgi:alkylation response protein AidB-like acyl-CoA dehydrogenase
MEHLGEPDHIVALRETLVRFVAKEMPRELARQWDAGTLWPAAAIKKLAALDVFGLAIAEEHGGSGPDIVATMVTIEELMRRSQSMAGTYIKGACYAGMNLVECGSAQQKAELLPKVVAGEMQFSYGLSEPDVGSDLASVKTTAVRDGDDVVVNGAKRFCSGARTVNYIYALVRSGPEADRYKNLSIVLVPPFAEGVTIEDQHAMGFKGSMTTDISFSDVRIPASNVMGGDAGWNSGWPMLIGPGLDVEKIEVAAMALGLARAAVDDAWAYSKERVQFGKPICSHQSIRHMLADAKTKLEACRLMTYNAAWMLQTGKPSKAITAMAKLFVCDTAKDIVLSCQQVMGAYGYVEEFDMARYVRNVLALPIIGGSSAIQRNNIANALGLPRGK